jgi:hypothetical protein
MDILFSLQIFYDPSRRRNSIQLVCQYNEIYPTLLDVMFISGREKGELGAGRYIVAGGQRENHPFNGVI